MRWKGNFSERDTKHWTPTMQTTLNYDPQSAKQFDNGKKDSIFPSVASRLSQRRIAKMSCVFMDSIFWWIFLWLTLFDVDLVTLLATSP